MGGADAERRAANHIRGKFLVARVITIYLEQCPQSRKPQLVPYTMGTLRPKPRGEPLITIPYIMTHYPSTPPWALQYEKCNARQSPQVHYHIRAAPVSYLARWTRLADLTGHFEPRNLGPKPLRC